MSKREYEKLVITAIELDDMDIITTSFVDGDGENYGTANKQWYTGGES